MISLINKRTIYTVLFFLLIINLIFISKPSPLFDKDNNVIQFGIGHDKTIFSLGGIVFILAFFTFYCFTLIDIIFDTYPAKEILLQ